jgi:hypothetical protein
MTPNSKLLLVTDRKPKCKFKKSCALFSNASYTCTHTGGKYCGKYRDLTQEQDNSAIESQGYLFGTPIIQ